MASSRPSTKLYVDSSFYRFLSRPKTTLFGNQYYYQEDSKDKPYQLKVIYPSKNKTERFFAWISYTFVNPIAFVVNKLEALGKEKQQTKRSIIKQNLTTATDKKVLPNNAISNSKLSYDALVSVFSEKEQELEYRFNAFKNKLTSEAAWNDEKVLAEFNAMYQEAALNFPVLVVAMHKLLREENNRDGIKGELSSPQKRATRIVCQGTGDWPYPYVKYYDNKTGDIIGTTQEAVHAYYHDDNVNSTNLSSDQFRERVHRSRTEKTYLIPNEHVLVFDLVYSMLVDMYHLARSRAYLTSRDASYYSAPKDIAKHATVSQFYDKKSKPLQYNWRQLYNANMKIFDSSFSDSDSDSDTKAFRQALGSKGTGDARVEKWTRVDTSKNETSFRPSPDTQPTGEKRLGRS